MVEEKVLNPSVRGQERGSMAIGFEVHHQPMVDEIEVVQIGCPREEVQHNLSMDLVHLLVLLPMHPCCQA